MEFANELILLTARPILVVTNLQGADESPDCKGAGFCICLRLILTKYKEINPFYYVLRVYDAS